MGGRSPISWSLIVSIFECQRFQVLSPHTTRLTSRAYGLSVACESPESCLIQSGSLDQLSDFHFLVIDLPSPISQGLVEPNNVPPGFCDWRGRVPQEPATSSILRLEC